MRLARAFHADGEESTSAASPPLSANTGAANVRSRSWPRRSNATAATAKSRNRSCRACIAKRRSTRSGKAQATSDQPARRPARSARRAPDR